MHARPSVSASRNLLRRDQAENEEDDAKHQEQKNKNFAIPAAAEAIPVKPRTLHNRNDQENNSPL